jgi:hypothetical protein
LTNLGLAKERVANRDKELAAAKEKARADFKDDDNPRKPSTLAEWSQQNAPAYIAAHNSWEAAVQDVESWENKVFGPGRQVLGKAKRNLQTAIEGITSAKR